MKISTIHFTLLLAVGLASMLCFSSPVKSMLGAERTTETEESNPNPYVTDGLVSMWDGEWNVGWGIHDDNATVWKDLVGTRDATLSGTYAWGEKYWDVHSVSGKGLATWDGTDLPYDQTIDILIQSSAQSNFARMMAEAHSIPSPCLVYGKVWVYGYGIDAGSQSIPNYNNYECHLHTITHQYNGQLNYYVDGELVWTSGTRDNSLGTTVGYFANRASFDRGIDAKYYRVNFYSRILSDEEIQHNYLIDKERFGL